ncbi:MAG: FtsB family cell division protein [Bacteroidota bacterium]
MLEKIPSFLKNKYVIVLIAAGVWILFFDQNNLIQQYRLSRRIKELNQEKKYYQNEIQRDSTYLDKLKHDPLELERYAREKYLMKKKNEDIFIIEE